MNGDMAEDDYMSDTFLQTLGQTSKSKSARSTTSAKRHGTLRSRPAQPKKRHIIEQEQRDKGLSTKLGASNKGFLMLKAMGYKGGALGKTEEGLIDPINVQVKTGRYEAALLLPTERWNLTFIDMLSCVQTSRA
jgi:hypothetical protein